MNDGPTAPTLAIVGPTASGKTLVSLALADRLGAEIVNLDAMQVFRGFDVGTAKPTDAERERAPHHLFDIQDPEQPLGAGAYAALANSAIKEVLNREKTPILVGGTGFYLRALQDGLAPIPMIPAQTRTALRRRLDIEGLEPLRAELEQIDPEWANKVHPNDSQRTLRGLEVYQHTQTPLSDFLAKPRQGALDSPLRTFLIQPDPELLRVRIENRAKEMLSSGWLEEVQSLIERGVSRDAHAFRASGYREVLEHLDGLLPYSELVSKVIRSHKAYARRQRTFFRSDKRLVKIDDAEDILRSLTDPSDAQ